MLKILVTGGTGYIGSHTCLQLIAAGMTPILLDNLANSKESVLERIQTLSGQRPVLYRGMCVMPACWIGCSRNSR